MKTKYTKKQISEAIAYWTKQLKEMNEADTYSVPLYAPDEYKKLDYSKASPDKKYIKILKYFYDNPNALKVDAVMDVFADMPLVKAASQSESPATALRGYAVTFFGQLVNDGLLKKTGSGSHNVRFEITDKGIDLLTDCGAI